jgi:hypothetical protein
MGYYNNDAKALWESYATEILNEVSWDQFPDVKKVCISPEDVAEKLNAELERLKSPSSEREKFNVNDPRISPGIIKKSMDDGEVNIKKFISQISKQPDTIFDYGTKSQHTTDEDVVTINTGIPALRAVLWDEDNEEFYVINTCPGAGQCVKNCYAMQRFYVMLDGKILKLINRLNLMMNDPDSYAKLALRELKTAAYDASLDDKTLMIRWNDAGDFFSEKYFNICLDVTKKLLDAGFKVKSYAYTKVAKYYKMGVDAGMIMNFSMGSNARELQQINPKESKISIILPESVFKNDIFVKVKGDIQKDENGKAKFLSEESRVLLKQRILDYYKSNSDKEHLWVKDVINLDNLKYTDELPRQQEERFKYNAIVLPKGDSDRPSQRSDVRVTILLEH